MTHPEEKKIRRFFLGAGVLIGIGFDAWFAQILDVTSVLMTKIGPLLYQWIPGRELFHPLILLAFMSWMAVLVILSITVVTFRWLRGPKKHKA